MAELALLPKLACEQFATSVGLMEQLERLPKQRGMARMSMIAPGKELVNSLKARTISLLSSTNRLYAKARVASIMPWLAGALPKEICSMWLVEMAEGI